MSVRVARSGHTLPSRTLMSPTLECVLFKIYRPRPSWDFTLGVKNEMGERAERTLKCSLPSRKRSLSDYLGLSDCVWVVCQQVDCLS